MKKIIFATLLALLLPLCAQAQTFEPCAKAENDLVYEEDNLGSDSDFSVIYELKLAQFVEARYGSPAYWRYVFAREDVGSAVSADTQDLLASKVGKDVSYLPKWITLHVYEKDELSNSQREKLSKLTNGSRANQSNIMEENGKIAVLTTSETLNSSYLKNFYGNFFPKMQQCGDEKYVAFAQYSVI